MPQLAWDILFWVGIVAGICLVTAVAYFALLYWVLSKIE